VGAAARTGRGGQWTSHLVQAYAEVEESEADLQRFERWLGKIAARDYFDAPGGAEACAAVDRCGDALAAFEAAALDSETGELAATAARPSQQRRLRAVEASRTGGR
jgi:hypothetical protein